MTQEEGVQADQQCRQTRQSIHPLQRHWQAERP